MKSGRVFACLLVMATICLEVKSQASRTDQCYADRVIPNATITFAYMASFHQDSSPEQTQACSVLNRAELQNYLTMEWVVERMNKANNNTGYIPGVKIGYFGMDDCTSPVLASRNAVTLLDFMEPNTLTCPRPVGRPLNIGIIGPTRSSTASRVASILRDVQFPILSAGASRPELSDKTVYPTFFRTIPPDIHQMRMIAGILKQLSWTYIVEIHMEDDYGNSASKVLAMEAAKHGICIHKSLAVNIGYLINVDFYRELSGLLESAKNHSLAVVFIGGSMSAEQLMWTLETKIVPVDKKVVKYGFHLILTDATNTDVTIFSDRTVGQGTLAVAPTGLFLEDVYTDLGGKFRRIKRGEERHELVEEFIRRFPNEDLFPDPDSFSPFIPSTVHAVFALIEALKNKHFTLCGGSSGLCSQLESSLKKGELVKAVSDIAVNYGKMPESVPPARFRDLGLVASFDVNKDLKLMEQVPVYTIHQLTARKKYEQVGMYKGGKLELETNKINMLTPSGQALNAPATSVCATRCDSCLQKGTIPLAYMEGDAYILGVFSLHQADSNDPFRCGSFRNVSNDAIVAEGFLYAVKDLRRITGINFGAIAIDDCYSPLRATSILTDYFSNIIASDSMILPYHIPRDKLVGVVGCLSSGCTIPTASFFMPLSVPVVSYAASSPDLDDKIDFPFFLRTVPSDVFQAQVMLRIIQYMKWEYVGLVYVKNNYGSKAMKAFKDLAMEEGSGVCVAKEIGINEKMSDLDDRDLNDVWIELIKQEVKVVVFLGIDVRYGNFLKHMEERERFGKFIFLGSEDWGTNTDILSSGQKSARGSLTLKVEDVNFGSEEAFRLHLASKFPSVNDSNIWFLEFWQHLFECNLKGGFINIFKSDCDPSQRISESEVANRAGEQRLKHVMNAVYAVGQGLKAAKDSLCEDEFPCKYLQQYAGQVVNKIKEQTRQDGPFRYNIFNDKGNGAIGFDVYNIQLTSPDTYKYVKVGVFNSKDSSLELNNLKFYNETGKVVESIAAKCTEFHCAHCVKPITTPITSPPASIGQASVSSSMYRDPDILIISLVVVLILAIVVVIVVIIICLTKKCGMFIHKKNEEQIYDEPERRRYEDYRMTHGFAFGNHDLNPYPVLPIQSVAEKTSLSGGQHGMVNPNFHPDDFDPVLPLSTPRLHTDVQPQSKAASEVMSTRTSSSQQSSFSPLETGGPMSNHSKSFMSPSSVCRGEMSDRDISSIQGKSYPSSYSSNCVSSKEAHSSIGSGVSPLNLACVQGSHPFARDMQARAESPGPEVVMYYMQGPDGQLIPQVGTPISEDVSRAPQVRLTSNDASGVNAYHGPYSFAAAQQKQQGKPMNMPLSTPSSKYKNPHLRSHSTDGGAEDIQLQDLGAHCILSVRNPSIKHTISDSGIESSPVHYASPSHSSRDEMPGQFFFTTPNPPAALQHLVTDEQRVTHSSSPSPHTTLPATMTAFHKVQQQDNYHDLQQQLQLQQAGDKSSRLQQANLVADTARYDNTQKRSTPDNAEEITPTNTLNRQVSLGDVDETSSRESLHDLDSNLSRNRNHRHSQLTLRSLDHDSHVTNV